MGSDIRLVHLRTVHTNFHAQVIAARLGAEGFVTQLRGNVGGPYPIAGGVSVWVREDDSEAASELLLADEVEDAFSSREDDEPSPHTARSLLQLLKRSRVLATIGLAVVMMTAIGTRWLG